MLGNYLHILRPTNLIIVAVSQVLLFRWYIDPLFTRYAIEPLLSIRLQWLFILDTVLIAAGGYVVNDIYDHGSDMTNKPDRSFIGNKKIGLGTAWLYYILIIGMGGLVAAYIAVTIDKPLLFVIYPIATLLLYLYSKIWKRRPLSGNIVVAIFCAFVPGIIWYAESEGMKLLHKINRSYVLLLVAYISFGFIATWAREIVKDMEDVEGDKEAGYHTYPISAGMQSARSMAVLLLFLLVSSYGLWLLALWRLEQWMGLGLTASLLLLPSILVIMLTLRSQEKADYTTISRYLKLIMLASLFVFTAILYNI